MHPPRPPWALPIARAGPGQMGAWLVLRPRPPAEAAAAEWLDWEAGLEVDSGDHAHSGDATN